MPPDSQATHSDHPEGLLQAIQKKRNTIAVTVVVAAVLCVVCSFFVSLAAVSLKEQQELNKELDRKANILRAAGLLRDGKNVSKLFDAYIKTKYVDLDTGEYVTFAEGTEYDQRAAAVDPNQSVVVPANPDYPALQRREKVSAVYFVYPDPDSDEFEAVVLPVYTKGLWSTMYGFLALEKDLRTVRGLGFYEHGETPGLGGEVDNPKWKQQWSGKLAYDKDGEIALQVLKGSVNPDSPNAVYQVDGLSGATITSRGVTNLLNYWLSDDGFGKFLEHLHLEGHKMAGTANGG